MKDRHRHTKRNSFAPNFGDLESRRLMASGSPIPALAAVYSSMPAVRDPDAVASVNAVRTVTFNAVRGMSMPAGFEARFTKMPGGNNSAMPLSNVIIQQLDVSTTLDGSLTIEFGKPMNSGTTSASSSTGQGRGSGHIEDSSLNMTEAGDGFHGPPMRDYFGESVRIEAARTLGLPPMIRLGWISSLMSTATQAKANSPLGFLFDGPDFAMAEPWSVVSAAKSHDKASAMSRSVDESVEFADLARVPSPGHATFGQDAALAIGDDACLWNSQSIAAVSPGAVSPAARMGWADPEVARLESRADDVLLNATGSDVSQPEPSDNWIAIAEAFGLDASLADDFVTEPLDESVEENGTALAAAIDRILSDYPGTTIDEVEEANIGRTLGIAAGVLIVVEAVRRRRQVESGRNGPEQPDEEAPTTEFDLRDARIE